MVLVNEIIHENDINDKKLENNIKKLLVLNEDRHLFL
jgi:hypothetical protein